MISGIGSDIVEISRIHQALLRWGDVFAHRILTPAEYALYTQKNDKTRFLAKRFAAKEAAVKALGTGFRQGLSWQHIEISHNALGQPHLQLRARALLLAQQKQICSCHVSVSDEQRYAVAFVVMECAASVSNDVLGM